MTVAYGKHMYLAAPFFNDGQIELCQFIEAYEEAEVIIYSPRLDGGVLKPDSSIEEIRSTYDENCIQIDQAAFVLAVIDDFDPGVVWEIGYASRAGTPILAYSDVPGRGLNVMLAGSANLGFINGRDDLDKFFRAFAGWNWDAFPRNTWSGEIQ